MKRTKILVLTICGLYFIVHVAFLIQAHATLQLSLILMFFALVVAFVVSLILSIRNWRTAGIKSVYLLLVCVLVIPAASAVGSFVRETRFEYVLLPEFSSVIAEVNKAEVSRDESRTVLKSKYAYVVWAEVAMNGKLHVMFLTDRGFPVRHKGYLYVEGSEIDKSARIVQRWRIFPYSEMPTWYHVRD